MTDFVNAVVCLLFLYPAVGLTDQTNTLFRKVHKVNVSLTQLFRLIDHANSEVGQYPLNNNILI